MSGPTYRFFIGYHKDTPTISNDVFFPIQLGRATSSLKLEMIGDDTGDNISSRNASWCELTALYWMWKNVDADFYGLFHYRRMLNFKVNELDRIYFDYSDETVEKFGWDKKDIEKFCSAYDVIVSTRWNVHPPGAPDRLMTNYEYYCRQHVKRDIDLAIGLIKEKTPQVYPYVLNYLFSKTCSFGNLSIMSRAVFHEYAGWLFSILFAAEKSIDIDRYDPYQRRVFGFLAERLGGGFIEYLAHRDGLKVCELDVVHGVFAPFVSNAGIVLKNIERQRSAAKTRAPAGEISVAFAVDSKYLPHCATAIASLLANLPDKQKIQIFIMHDGTLPSEDKNLVASLTRNSPGQKIFFVEMDATRFQDFPHNRQYISTATYFRLAIHDALPRDLDKVIYLDADVLVEDNIAPLWEIAFADGELIAGCLDEGGRQQNQRLQLPYEHPYFNGGVLVFNLAALRNAAIANEYSSSYHYNIDYVTLQDQDILNITFVGRVKVLPLRWNANGRLYRPNELEYAYSNEEALTAAENPAIIHFTDSVKPWDPACTHPLKALYWQWREATPFKRDDVAGAASKRRWLQRLPAGRRFEELPTHAELSRHLTRTTKLSRGLAHFGLAVDRLTFPIGAALYHCGQFFRVLLNHS